MANNREGRAPTNTWTEIPTGGAWTGAGLGYGATGFGTAGGAGGFGYGAGPGFGFGYTGTTTYDVNRTPLIDVIETDNNILITAELPGVNKDDIDVDVRDFSLDISVDTVIQPSPTETIRYSRSERGSTGFYRTVALPLKVDPKNASAKFENGLLEITIEKSEENKHENEHISIQ